MGKSGLAVPLAALLCGVFSAAAAAQLALTSAGTTANEPLAGNPLSAIPLSDLAQTGARPLFSPSRRPAAAPVLAAFTSSPATPPPRSKPEPDHPLLTLLGTIVSESVEAGVFVDEASHEVIRLKVGDAHGGWTLSSVVGRAAFFQKEGHRAATLALPAPGAEAIAASGRAAAATGGNDRMRVAPPVSNIVPANTEGGARRPPKEG